MQNRLISGTGKVESAYNRKYACIILLTFLCIAFAACKQNKSKNLSSTVVIKDSSSIVDKNLPLAEEKYQDPPKSLIQNLKQQALHIVLVNVTTVDSVYNSEKIFSAKILKSFKGRLKAGDSLKYMAMNDMKYVKHPNDTLIVFLDKSKSPVSSGDKDVFLYALENASFIGNKYLDSLLTRK
ncbi:hypothetical protein [Pedobacter alluvionis]|uniref:Uncharacterized protein n=1 Tax=Pedobacter alluvionis TaxID=475253 RepID=A0A497Y6R6_9SPHI|nr:hypothetical protein [Pedobacter alluvionis]RLJ76648.1 hypothetical protein BCL90_1691 [Pedobacter alluvionis]TFB34073.1 hypothetical protein E3V97_08530 [Pedobacter alluvionis]